MIVPRYSVPPRRTVVTHYGRTPGHPLSTQHPRPRSLILSPLYLRPSHLSTSASPLLYPVIDLSLRELSNKTSTLSELDQIKTVTLSNGDELFSSFTPSFGTSSASLTFLTPPNPPT